MKKYLVGILLASMLVVVPYVSSATSTALSVYKQSARIEQIYGGRDEVVSIVGVFELSILNQTDKPIFITKSLPYPISSGFYNMNRGEIIRPNGCNSFSEPTSNDFRLVYNRSNTPYVVIEANKALNYRVLISCPTNQLFSGYYFAKLGELLYSRDINSVGYESISLGDIVTNQKMIFGETSPWIESVNLSATPGWLEIWGERLEQVQTIYVGSKVSNLQSTNRSDKLSVYYGNLPTGQYPVYTISKKGEKSNQVYFSIQSTTTPQSVITINPSASTLRAYPGGWIKVRGTNLTTLVTFVNGSPVLSPKLSDGNKRLDFKIDTNMAPGVYPLRVSNPSTEAFVDITVVARPTTTATTTSMSSSKMGQLANILSSLSSILEQLKNQ